MNTARAEQRVGDSVPTWFHDRRGARRCDAPARLANERTYLAWWRSGLTALAVGLAAGKLVPELSSGAAWPYELLGVGYSLLGVAFIAYGHQRQGAVEAAVGRGEWAPIDPRAETVFTAAGILLGAATIAVVILAGS